MDEEGQLPDIARLRARNKPRRAVKLGDVVAELVDKRISPQQEKFGAVAEAWDQLLPAELSEHCKLSDVSGGQLKVKADSPVYVHELRLCSEELLEQVQQLCPRARIKGIRISIG